MPNGKNSVNTETVQEAARRQLLRFADNNLHIAAYFFEKAIWEVLIPKWELVDWWYRFEWQHHGSVQVHGIAKRKEAPEIDWEKMKNNDEIMEEGWSANVDLIPILTTQYVSKYASEAEPRSLGSLAFSEVLDKAHRNDDPNDPAVKPFQNVSPLQRYCNRPAELEELSLFKLDQQYKLVKGNWVGCSENHTLSWIDLYNQHLVEINDDSNDLIGPAVDDIQEVEGNDSDEEDDDTP
ncbi:hypothetical protein RhiirA5_498421 [Rhizophagus irregularis]|uniref:Uncharacterized protein n=1 Tax=Rhizophagus irregularis TaxID=588596 RepID=A0A2I1E1K1_9GLOM|nr:hypothetical protein RhiirA5_498421 [Rhizophagus irregularis]PKY16012.1 hypothetical protein RhiirB3_520857 [Rhizophagus irregularis]